MIGDRVCGVDGRIQGVGRGYGGVYEAISSGEPVVEGSRGGRMELLGKL